MNSIGETIRNTRKQKLTLKKVAQAPLYPYLFSVKLNAIRRIRLSVF